MTETPGGFGIKLLRAVGLRKPITPPIISIPTEKLADLAMTELERIRSNVVRSLATPAAIERDRVPEATPDVVGQLAKALPERVQEQVQRMQTTPEGRAQIQQMEDARVQDRITQYMRFLSRLVSTEQESQIVQQLFKQLAAQAASAFNMQGKEMRAINAVMNGAFAGGILPGVGITHLSVLVK